jgi:arsenical pump membrane protein
MIANNITVVIWLVTALTTGFILFRPWNLPEFYWAVAAAVFLTLFGFIPYDHAVKAIFEGTDVYFFLIGMMALAELARKEGLFDWLAMVAALHAKGSGQKLFDLIFLVGILVTVFLSNDATAVVLTPAVYAACKATKADPLPYLFICAFIANAASFVLPISNPANLVIFGSHMPPLFTWLAQFSLPSLAAIAITYLVLRFAHRNQLKKPLERHVDVQSISIGAKLTGLGIVFTGILLLLASAKSFQLGLPTFCAGIATLSLVHIKKRTNPLPVLKDIAWGVIPLVAGLFILVEAMAQTGVIDTLAQSLAILALHSQLQATWSVGIITAIASNLINNLPAGLIAGSIGQIVELPKNVTAAMLIGVDLGPNLSITGSLATLLWLIAVRREGVQIKAVTFLALGVLVMPPALISALSFLGI